MTDDSSAPRENSHIAGDVNTRTIPAQMKVDDFLELVRRSNLVDKDNLKALLRTLRKRTGGSETSPHLVAELLVQAKLLTEWQASQLLHGQFEDFFLGRYYLVMEYVDGANLDEIVSRRGPLPFAAAANYIRQAADGLAHAHDQGIIHRDIKPANLMLDSMGRIKILDMGLSHWKEVEASPKATRGEISGTPSYIAPELAIAAGDVDTSSDIYSLGCTFHFLVTGVPPFAADSITEILHKHLNEPPPRLTKFAADLPAGLEQIYLQMMEKRPADRYANAREVFEALTDWHRKSDEPAAAATTEDGAQEVSEQNYTILVAEDDPVTQQMLSLQLKKAGFAVRAAVVVTKKETNKAAVRSTFSSASHLD